MQQISIFVSSTFQDMDLERDCLNLYILPRLNEYYNPKGYSVQLIDLRWGVTTDEIKNEKDKEGAILKTCLDVIDNCRPFFIGFIGERYGWIPPTNTLCKSVPESIFNNLSADALSVTQLEIEYGIVQKEMYSSSLIFTRSKESYNGLNEKIKYSYCGESDEIKTIRFKRNSYIKDCFIKSGFESHIVEYTIPLAYQHISECSSFIDFVYSRLIDLIDANLENNGGNVLFDDWITHQMLKNYIQDDNIVKGIIYDLSKNKDVLIYGPSNSGKTSITLYLRFLFKYVFSESIILYYSPQIYGKNQFAQILTKWIIVINSSIQLPNLTSIENVWKWFAHAAEESEKHIIIIIDSFDKNEEMLNANFMLSHSPYIHFVLSSSIPLKRWEIFSKIKGKQIPYLTKESASRLIENICKEYNKNLPIIAKKTLLETRLLNSIEYSASDLKKILTVILNFTKSDFENIRSDKNSPENSINNYILKTINEFPKDKIEQSKYVVRRMLDIFTPNDLLPFYLISISIVGLNESELAKCLGQNFNLTSFSIIRHYLSPYLSPNNTSGKWSFSDDNISLMLIETLPQNEQQQLYSMLVSNQIGLELQVYYSIKSHSSLSIIRAIKFILTQNNDSESSFFKLIFSNISSSYLEGEDIIWILHKDTENYKEVNIEDILDILVFSFPRAYITGHGKISKSDYFKSLLHFIEDLTDLNCGTVQNKYYYLGITAMGYAQTISQFTFNDNDRVKGIELYNLSLKYFNLCNDSSIAEHIEHCYKQILNLQN